MDSNQGYYPGFKGEVDFRQLPAGTRMRGLISGREYVIEDREYVIEENETIVNTYIKFRFHFDDVGRGMEILEIPGWEDQDKELWV